MAGHLKLARSNFRVGTCMRPAAAAEELTRPGSVVAVRARSVCGSRAGAAAAAMLGNCLPLVTQKVQQAARGHSHRSFQRSLSLSQPHALDGLYRFSDANHWYTGNTEHMLYCW